MIRENGEAGKTLISFANGSIEAITAETVARAASAGDRLSLALLEKVGRALVAGCASVVNAFNPCRLILGGGVIDGVPELIDKVRVGARRLALPAATSGLDVLPGMLGSNAGVVGSASLAMRTFGKEGRRMGK